MNALDFLSEYDGGSLEIEKWGTKQHEHWIIVFTVGYSQKKYQGEGKTLNESIDEAVLTWPQGLVAWNIFKDKIAQAAIDCEATSQECQKELEQLKTQNNELRNEVDDLERWLLDRDQVSPMKH